MKSLQILWLMSLLLSLPNLVNSQSAWKNPDSGNSGVIYPTKTYSIGDQPCREFTQEIIIGGKIQTGYGKACRMADGSWDIQ